MKTHRRNSQLPVSLYDGRLRINTAAEAEHLHCFPSVVSIEIQSSALNSMNTKLLSACQHLKWIVVKDYTGESLDLRFFDDMAALEQFVEVQNPLLRDDTPTQVTTSNWILPVHPRITVMTLRGVAPGVDFIDRVSTWNLDHLRFHYVNFDSSRCQLLSRLAVGLLVLQGCRLPFLPEIGNIGNLQIRYGSVADTLDLNNLSLSKTRQLAIDLGGVTHFVELSRQLPSLESLILENLSPDHVPLLDRFPKTLKKLELWLGSIGNEYLPIIKRMFSLEELFISSTIAHLDLSILDGHQHLRKLFIRAPHVNDDLRPPRLPNIEDLSLQRDTGSPMLDHLDLSPLTNSARLIELKITDCPAYKIDLSPLSSCKNLRELHLFGNQIEEYNLTPLLHLKSLDLLYVGNSLMQSPVLFADSRLKDTVESPAIQRLVEDDEIEWR